MAEKVEKFVENFFKDKEFLPKGIRSIEDLRRVQFGKPQNNKGDPKKSKDSTESFDPPKED